MKIKALIGAAALSALTLSGAAFAQEAGSSPAPAAAPSGPGTMQPIPNPPTSGAKHAKSHKAKKHHKAARKSAKSSKAAKQAPSTSPAPSGSAPPAQ